MPANPLVRPRNPLNRVHTMSWIAVSCKKATELMVAREDRTLKWGERMGLGFHLRMCNGCQVFDRQMLTLRATLKGWRNQVPADTEPTDAH
jgi:hypothetical protein